MVDLIYFCVSRTSSIVFMEVLEQEGGKEC